MTDRKGMIPLILDGNGPVGRLMRFAAVKGAGGEFVTANGVTEDGRPFIIAIGVGDGCAELHRIIAAKSKET